jgi:hypothetical protein
VALMALPRASLGWYSSVRWSSSAMAVGVVSGEVGGRGWYVTNGWSAASRSSCDQSRREGGSFRCASESVGLGMRMRASQIYFYSTHIASPNE